MATAIRVVLKEDVTNLGSSGDVVRVRPGYARNYLIPRGLALPATEGNLAHVEEVKRQAHQRADRSKSEAQKLSEQLNGASVKIARSVGDEEKMYGSVTAKDIEEAFAKQGIKLDRKKIQLSEPIKHLGVTEVPFRLPAGLSANLRVEVVKKSS